MADLDEPESLKAGDHFARLEDGDGPHGVGGLRHEDSLRSNELRLERRVPVLQEHRDYLAEVGMQLVEAVPLSVCPRKPGNVPDEDTRLWIALNYGGVSAHNS